MIIMLVAIIYTILVDEIVMSLSQRRFGPFNIGIMGLLASIVNGLNLLVIQSFFIMSSYSFVMFLLPLVFLGLLLVVLSTISPLYIIDVS
jgi:NADH:ubiquinone oxidoreductase subunit H